MRRRWRVLGGGRSDGSRKRERSHSLARFEQFLEAPRRSDVQFSLQQPLQLLVAAPRRRALARRRILLDQLVVRLFRQRIGLDGAPERLDGALEITLLGPRRRELAERGDITCG